MAGCSHDCESCSSKCGKESFLVKQNELSNVKKVIGVVSGKGGVGKSLVTSLLAVGARRDGKSVAVLDADITGPSIPRAFGVNHKRAESMDGKYIFPVETSTGIKVMSLNLLIDDETKPVIWRGPILAETVKQFWRDVVWGDVDCMYVDMPPGTGDVPLTAFQSLPLDGIIVVTSPQELVGMIVSKAVNMASPTTSAPSAAVVPRSSGPAEQPSSPKSSASRTACVFPSVRILPKRWTKVWWSMWTKA